MAFYKALLFLRRPLCCPDCGSVHDQVHWVHLVRQRRIVLGAICHFRSVRVASNSTQARILWKLRGLTPIGASFFNCPQSFMSSGDGHARAASLNRMIRRSRATLDLDLVWVVDQEDNWPSTFRCAFQASNSQALQLLKRVVDRDDER